MRRESDAPAAGSRISDYHTPFAVAPLVRYVYEQTFDLEHRRQPLVHWLHAEPMECIFS